MLRLIEQVYKMEFWEVYDQYYSQVKKVILALVRDSWVADDLTQETFARAQDHLAELKDPAKLSSWIFRIAYNLCRDHFRKKGESLNDNGLDHEEQAGAETISTEKAFERREMGECVQQEIDRLPEPLRAVIILSDMLEFSRLEIADILGITVENTKVRLHRARKKLRALLEQKCRFESDERSILVCEPKNKLHC